MTDCYTVITNGLRRRYPNLYGRPVPRVERPLCESCARPAGSPACYTCVHSEDSRAAGDGVYNNFRYA